MVHASLKAALDHAETDLTVWKISFRTPEDDDVRLVKQHSLDADGKDIYIWVYEPMSRVLAAILAAEEDKDNKNGGPLVSRR
jgi:hypothetical protein